MRYFLILLLALFVFVGCSSTKKLTPDEQDEFSAITNEDFKQDKEIPYKSSSDIIEEDISESDSLINESLARIDRGIEASGKLKDPISKIAAFCHEGNFREGFRVAETVYTKFRNHPPYWNQIGTCYMRQNDLKLSVIYYNKALEIKARYIPAINNLAVIFLRKNQNQKAMALFTKALKINSYALTPAFNAGQLLLKYHQGKQAEKLFRRLRGQNDQDSEVTAGLATALMIQGKYDESVELFQSLDSEWLERADIGLGYVRALIEKGDRREAKKVFFDIRENTVRGMKREYSTLRRRL